MSLLEFNLDPTRIAKALERIADCLERAFPKIDVILPGKPAQADAVFTFDPEEEYLREQEEERQKALGVLPSPRRF